MADLERIRLVLLGGAGVGKSSIVKRFLFKSYTDKYRATVEDLYNREYDLGGVTLKVSATRTPALSAARVITIEAAYLLPSVNNCPLSPALAIPSRGAEVSQASKANA